MLEWIARSMTSLAAEPGRVVSGCMAGLAAIFSPIRGLVVCAVLFVGVDFVTGVVASRVRARREGRPWAFVSRRAWNTVLKLWFLVAGIVLTWLLDSVVVPFLGLRLANVFTGFACGVELWSFLENASVISSSPLFVRFRSYFRKRME